MIVAPAKIVSNQIRAKASDLKSADSRGWSSVEIKEEDGLGLKIGGNNYS
jgi:hypothetical protein